MSPRIIAVVGMPLVADDEFTQFLQDTKPHFVVDLRYSPTFAHGNLDRKSAFALFQELGCRYIDTFTSFSQSVPGKLRGFTETHSDKTIVFLTDSGLNASLLRTVGGLPSPDGTREYRYCPKEYGETCRKLVDPMRTCWVCSATMEAHDAVFWGFHPTSDFTEVC